MTDLERDVIHMNESDYQLKKNYLELKEWEAVLEKTDLFFQGVGFYIFCYFNPKFLRGLMTQQSKKLSRLKKLKLAFNYVLIRNQLG